MNAQFSSINKQIESNQMHMPIGKEKNEPSPLNDLEIKGLRSRISQIRKQIQQINNPESFETQRLTISLQELQLKEMHHFYAVEKKERKRLHSELDVSEKTRVSQEITFRDQINDHQKINDRATKKIKSLESTLSRIETENNRMTQELDTNSQLLRKATEETVSLGQRLKEQKNKFQSEAQTLEETMAQKNETNRMLQEKMTTLVQTNEQFHKQIEEGKRNLTNLRGELQTKNSEKEAWQLKATNLQERLQGNAQRYTTLANNINSIKNHAAMILSLIGGKVIFVDQRTATSNGLPVLQANSINGFPNALQNPPNLPPSNMNIVLNPTRSVINNPFIQTSTTQTTTSPSNQNSTTQTTTSTSNQTSTTQTTTSPSHQNSTTQTTTSPSSQTSTTQTTTPSSSSDKTDANITGKKRKR